MRTCSECTHWERIEPGKPEGFCNAEIPMWLVIKLVRAVPRIIPYKSPNNIKDVDTMADSCQCFEEWERETNKCSGCYEAATQGGGCQECNLCSDCCQCGIMDRYY